MSGGASNSKESAAGKEVNIRKKPPSHKQWIRWAALVLSLTALVFAIVLLAFRQQIAAASVFLAGAVLSTIFAKGPGLASDPWPSAPLILLASSQALFIVAVASSGVATTISPAALIRFTAFGLAGACVAGVVAAKWLAPSKLAEPIALGIAALLLILVCIPGLISLAQPLHFPADSGDGLLFVAGPASQNVTMNASTTGIDRPTYENLVISTTGRRRERWVLVLSGPARMTVRDHSVPINVRTVKESHKDTGFLGSAREAQLFSGYVDSTSPVYIDGTSIGSFTGFNSDRIAFTLPFYSIGVSGDVGPTVMTTVDRLLGAKPILPNHSKVRVFSGPYFASDTVTGSIPPPLPTSSQYGMLEWSSDLGNPISYTVMIQDLADLASITLFLLAFLLGVAGAGLFAGLQSGIHLYLSSRDSEPESVRKHEERTV